MSEEFDDLVQSFIETDPYFYAETKEDQDEHFDETARELKTFIDKLKECGYAIVKVL